MKLKTTSLLLAVALLFFFSPDARSLTIDFDDLSPGTIVGTIEGVTFTSNIGLPLTVSTGFDTTTGFNYLGVNDGGWELFFPNDVVTLTFDTPATSLTVDFISSPFTSGEVFSIETNLGSSLR